MDMRIDDLIPELKEWNNSSGISVRSWIGAVGRYDHAIGYSALFWPRFALIEECIFLDEPDPTNFAQWLQGAGGDRSRLESVMNHRHLADLFPNSQYASTADILLYLGEVLREMWTCKLAIDYPARRVEVHLEQDLPSGYCITVFQPRAGREPKPGGS